MSHLKPLSSLSIFLPAFNEEKNLEPMVSQTLKIAKKVALKYEIILINDGSNDNTGKIADQIVAKNNCVKVIHHPKNLGYGMALRSGFSHAKYDWTFFTDSDMQFNLAHLLKFITHTASFDVIIGYRINRAEGRLRAFNAWLFKQYVNLLFRVRVKDIDCAFKLFRTSVVKTLPLESRGAMISAEILYRLKKQNIAFKQLPVRHLPRQFGSPTGNNPRVVIKAGLEALRLYLSIKFPFLFKKLLVNNNQSSSKTHTLAS